MGNSMSMTNASTVTSAGKPRPQILSVTTMAVILLSTNSRSLPRKKRFAGRRWKVVQSRRSAPMAGKFLSRRSLTVEFDGQAGKPALRERSYKSRPFYRGLRLQCGGRRASRSQDLRSVWCLRANRAHLRSRGDARQSTRMGTSARTLFESKSKFFSKVFRSLPSRPACSIPPK